MEPLPHRDVQIRARDGYTLTGSVVSKGESSRRVVVINSATAVPRRFYRRFAAHLAEAGYTVVTYDYRGVGDSRPTTLRGFEARMRDWGMLDMAGVVDWTRSEFGPDKLFLIGHSVGGQVAGLLDNADAVDGMITLSSQSGHWRLQGGEQKAAVFFHVHLSMPLLVRTFGYMPWSKFTAAEDLPAGVALEWARWCRDRSYLLGDDSLPLDRYAKFDAPVLAYSFGDDKWGTSRSVDAMMRAYPNLERKHVEPRDAELKSIGHFGFFRPQASALWSDAVGWLDTH